MSGRAGVLAAATPATRDRVVDLVRGASMIAVVVGHWLVTDYVWDGQSLMLRSTLGEAPGLWPLSWLLQVIPLFFCVGGVANRLSWLAAQRRGDPYGVFLLHRLHRLLRPTLVLLAFAVGASVLVRATVGDIGLGAAGGVLFQPLWFLGVYVVIVAMVPLTLRWHDRYGRGVLVVLLLLAALGDAARLTGVLSGLALVNALTVWLFFHQLGYFVGEGRVSRRLAFALFVGGLALAGLIVATPAYPAAMVGVPGMPFSNMNPPSLAVTALGLAQVGGMVLATPWLRRWLDRPRVWVAVVVMVGVAMTVFLWHQVVLAGVARVVAPLQAPPPPVATAAWWGQHLLLLGTAGLVLVVVAMALRGLEHGPAPAACWDAATTRVLTLGATALAALGLLGVAGSDLTHLLQITLAIGFPVVPLVPLVAVASSGVLVRVASAPAVRRPLALLVGSAGALALVALVLATGLGPAPVVVPSAAVAGALVVPVLAAVLAVGSATQARAGQSAAGGSGPTALPGRQNA